MVQYTCAICGIKLTSLAEIDEHEERHQLQSIIDNTKPAQTNHQMRNQLQKSSTNKGISMLCHRCKHAWKYTGVLHEYKKHAQCPRCHTSVKIRT